MIIVLSEFTEGFFCNKSKHVSSSSGSEDKRFWGVPDKEWLKNLLRKRCNTQLLSIRNHWTKEILVDGIHHMLISIKNLKFILIQNRGKFYFVPFHKYNISSIYSVL